MARFSASITAACAAENLGVEQEKQKSATDKQAQALLDAEERAKENAEKDYIANGSRPCTTNPTSKGSAAKKLVWVTLDCLNTNAEIKSTTALIAQLKAAGTASASEISTAETLNSTAKDLLSVVCGKGW